MASLNPLDHMTHAELTLAADCIADAIEAMPRPLCERDGTRRFYLRNAASKLLAASLCVEPTATDFAVCADIMRRCGDG